MSFQGWKTAVFFVLMLAVGIANQVGFAGFELPPDLAEWLAVLIALGGLILRHVTNSPAGWRR
jgi:hypothetical protein